MCFEAGTQIWCELSSYLARLVFLNLKVLSIFGFDKHRSLVRYKTWMVEGCIQKSGARHNEGPVFRYMIKPSVGIYLRRFPETEGSCRRRCRRRHGSDGSAYVFTAAST